MEAREYLEKLVAASRVAQAEFVTYPQEKVDAAATYATRVGENVDALVSNFDDEELYETCSYFLYRAVMKMHSNIIENEK